MKQSISIHAVFAGFLAAFVGYASSFTVTVQGLLTFWCLHFGAGLLRFLQ
jgi:putative Mn2+ efflux pump MntP